MSWYHLGMGAALSAVMQVMRSKELSLDEDPDGALQGLGSARVCCSAWHDFNIFQSSCGIILWNHLVESSKGEGFTKKSLQQSPQVSRILTDSDFMFHRMVFFIDMDSQGHIWYTQGEFRRVSYGWHWISYPALIQPKCKNCGWLDYSDMYRQSGGNRWTEAMCKALTYSWYDWYDHETVWIRRSFIMQSKSTDLKVSAGLTLTEGFCPLYVWFNFEG